MCLNIVIAGTSGAIFNPAIPAPKAGSIPNLAVVAMFSRKKMNHLDFELFGLFSEQLSKELTGFFEAKDFLSE